MGEIGYSSSRPQAPKVQSSRASQCQRLRAHSVRLNYNYLYCILCSLGLLLFFIFPLSLLLSSLKICFYSLFSFVLTREVYSLIVPHVTWFDGLLGAVYLFMCLEVCLTSILFPSFFFPRFSRFSRCSRFLFCTPLTPFQGIRFRPRRLPLWVANGNGSSRHHPLALSPLYLLLRWQHSPLHVAFVLCYFFFLVFHASQ